ncbi:MAG: 50S ribosomal protein L9 [Nitriliruptoraceae bacterium]
MKVILKSEVDNLGLPGDVVDVADGYGRNYLVPRGLAILATAGAMKEAQALTRSRKAAEAKTVGAATAAKDALEARALKISARVDDHGGLYGSVSTVDIQRVLKERGHDIDRRRIELKGTLKQLGTYEIPVRVHPQVTATVILDVVDVEGRVGAGGALLDADDQDAEASSDIDVLTEQAIEAAEELEAAEAVKTEAEAEAAAESEEAVDDTGAEEDAATGTVRT